MNFTFESYCRLVEMLRAHGYTIASYDDYESAGRCVILRHDIDTRPEAALEMAQLEHEIGARSTYFVLVTSDFYNAFSYRNREIFREIRSLGHDIGLHFDEVSYPEAAGDASAVVDRISAEARLLSQALGFEIRAVSMHRPSQATLDADLQIPGMVNSYSSAFFHDFKYVSDSRRRWREPVEDIIQSEQYERIHILTHAFWYSRSWGTNHSNIRSGGGAESYRGHTRHYFSLR